MPDCIFCKIIAGKIPAHVVYEDDDTIAFLDKYPQIRGHLQLIPKKHYRWIYELPDIGSFFQVAQIIIRGIIPVLGAHHVTIATYGHEIAHAHLWIVPQYKKIIRIEESQGKKVASQIELVSLLKETLNSNIKAQVSSKT